MTSVDTDMVSGRRPPRCRRTIAEDGPDPIDVHVGKRMRERRTLLGMSQEMLADAFGISFQQVQKYERGANRIGASRLHMLSKLLDVPVSYFYDGLPSTSDEVDATPIKASSRRDPTTSRETLELVRAYYRIDEPSLRRRLVDLARALNTGEKQSA